MPVEPISQRKPIERPNPNMQTLVTIKINIPNGARFAGTYRTEDGIEIQLWTTEEVKDQIVATFMGLVEDESR